MIKEGLGLNMFSIRNYLDTEEHFLEAAKKLKEMGYSYMQFSGAPFEPKMIKSARYCAHIARGLLVIPLPA